MWYNTSYTASITLIADTDYEFTDSTTATINGNTATSVNKNADGTLTVTYAFPATAKDKLTSITAPQPITVANGTAYDAMNLPATVNIVTEGNTESSAQVTWDTTTRNCRFTSIGCIVNRCSHCGRSKCYRLILWISSGCRICCRCTNDACRTYGDRNSGTKHYNNHQGNRCSERYAG